MNIKPLYDRILVKREKAEEVTAGGIIIPDTSKEKPSKGTIIAVGEGNFNEKDERIPLTVKVGDKVLFSRYGGTEFKNNDEELLVMKESDILGIIEE
jgi:chaperonin GroES